ncbi:prolyl oligopeptidase family serine peptidase [Nannocystaceae bacterium ST9]
MLCVSRSLPLATLLALACAPPNPATPYPTTEPPEGDAAATEQTPSDPLAIDFLDRRVDLEPFLRGFPYRSFMPALEHDRLFFVATGERYELRMAAIPSAGGPAIDLAAAEPVSPADWSQRSLWSVHYQREADTLWLHADARNDEQMNLWRISLAQPLAERVPEQLTFADYVYAYGFSEDEQTIAYLARSGQQAPYETCLRLLDAADPTREKADREIVCDSPELSFTWGSPRFSIDAGKLYFNAQVAGDRKRVQILEVDLRSEVPKPTPITDPGQPRSSANMLDGWFGEWLFYTADDREFGDVYAWSSKTRKTRKLTDLKEELLGATLTDRGILLAHGTPAGSTLELIDRKTGKLLGSAGAPGHVTIEDGHGDRAIWSQASPSQVFELSLARFSSAADGSLDMQTERLVALEPELEHALVRCEPERVAIPTFDGRELHAWLLAPREPLAGPAIAMVRSFYGGENEWNDYDQVLCAAGITVISPAVRGSDGFGKQFAALNDRDLGGREIVDLFMVARWAEQRLGIGHERIGVYGRSHGGYATLRALTWPHDDPQFYPFGFGLAEAGFSDIVAFFHATNIPDWVVLEAGDPSVPADLAQLNDRSPLAHVERLSAPVFLLHGANDWRVPVEGSRAFAERATELGKSVTYLEVAGQGHRVEGDARIVESWQARFDFIASALASEG